MKCPMAPWTLSSWRLALHLTFLGYVHEAILDKAPSVGIQRWHYDVATLNTTFPITSYESFDARERRSPRRNVRSLDNASVPQFMKDFYEHYARNAVLQPSYDVIRSFYPQRAEFADNLLGENHTWILTFRLTSLKMERVKLAELRIFFMLKDSWQKSQTAIVNVLEMRRDRKTGYVRRKRLVSTAKVGGTTDKAGKIMDQWLHLNVTRLARRTFRRRSSDLELAIIMSPGKSEFVPEILIEENVSPVLVVYSDEVQASSFSDYATSWRRWRRRTLRNQTLSETPKPVPYNLTSFVSNYGLINSSNLTSISHKQDPLTAQNSARLRTPRSAQVRRTKKLTKQRRRRRGCRRKAMYVRFEDINWHNQIIAPRGYQAYRCVGKCFFPLSDRLSPTKHAIIQTLLHTNHPDAVSRPCCVPTALDPIPILYIDENGVVTYKYRFEGMVASQCGCR